MKQDGCMKVWSICILVALLLPPLCLRAQAPNNPPNVPASPTPADGAVGQNNTLTLSWTGGDPDGDSVLYDLCIRPEEATPNNPDSFWKPPVVYEDLTAPSFCRSFDSDYPICWYVVAQDEHGARTSGPTWRFTTLPNHRPVVHALTPAYEATSQSTTALTLSWTTTDPDGDAVGGCTVRYGTSCIRLPPPGQGAIIPGGVEISDIRTSSYTIPQLLPNQDYYWMVMTSDEHGRPSYPAVWKFKTGAGPILQRPKAKPIKIPK